jgi:penicillin-binding protein 1A
MSQKRIPPSFEKRAPRDEGLVAQRVVRRADAQPKRGGGGSGGNGGGRRPPVDDSERSWKWRLFKLSFKSFLALCALGFIFGFFTVTYYAHDLPDIDKLYESKLKPSITILDANDNFVVTYGDLFTENIEYKQLPKTLVDAVVATEDRRFFSHFGVDPLGLVRAMYVNFRAGGVVQGGSTITQQLAKIIFLKPERAMKRKIQEAILALWLERKFTKEQILSMYLNRVYLGAGTYGVDAASRKYFGKKASELNLYESAMIAGLLKAPTTYSPTNNARAAADRTETVLLAMVDAEKITDEQRKRALQTGTKVGVSKIRENSRYFSDYVMEVLPQFVPNYTDQSKKKLIVKTTFQPGVQKFAEDAIASNMMQFSKQNGAAQAAILSMRPDGAIMAMVGGVDYAESQFNRATQAKRQPGSLFKLFVYMAALEAGMKPSDLVLDEAFSVKTGGKTWSPKNYDGKYNGEVSLSYALAHSLNVATARLSETVGRAKVLELARRLGIKSSLQDVPSVALGSSEVTLLEMVQSFATLPNKGVAVAPYVIEKVTDEDGEVLYERQGDYDLQVLSGNAVKMMNGMLMSVAEDGTAKNAQFGRDIAGKTGTTQNFRDAWFVGYTPELVAGVWLGNDNNKAMNRVTGGSTPARIWKDFMSNVLAETPATSIDTNPFPEIQGTPWEDDNNFGGSRGDSDKSDSKSQGFWDSLLEF